MVSKHCNRIEFEKNQMGINEEQGGMSGFRGVCWRMDAELWGRATTFCFLIIVLFRCIKWEVWAPFLIHANLRRLSSDSMSWLGPLMEFYSCVNL